MYARPRLRDAGPEGRGQIPNYFKDSSFGVPAGQAERTLLAARRRHDRARQGLRRAARLRHDARRRDVRPRLRGAEDRLFFMDVLRHAGRGELSSFAGGANAAMDAEQWEVAPVHRGRPRSARSTQPPDVLGAQGAQILRATSTTTSPASTSTSPRRKLDPTKMPGEYAAIGQPQGPDPWKRDGPDRDRVARRRHLRQGRRQRARVVAGRRRARQALRQASSGAARVQGLPRGRGPGGAGHGARQEALPLPGARRSSRAGVGAARPRLARSTT